jgi:hypothetical protein
LQPAFGRILHKHCPPIQSFPIAPSNVVAGEQNLELQEEADQEFTGVCRWNMEHIFFKTHGMLFVTPGCRSFMSL